MPYDFSKPFFPSTATDKNQPTNINLFTNPIPFYPVDLSKPFFPGNVPAAPLPVNPNLYVVVTAVPFIPLDFSKTYFPRGLVNGNQPANPNCSRTRFRPIRRICRARLLRTMCFRRPL